MFCAIIPKIQCNLTFTCQIMSFGFGFPGAWSPLCFPAGVSLVPWGSGTGQAPGTRYAPPGKVLRPLTEEVLVKAELSGRLLSSSISLRINSL